MRIVCISDTHGRHNFSVPYGDVLIHAGDLTMRGERSEVDRFLGWFGGQPHPFKVFIAGNHDFWFERNRLKMSTDSLVYLQDSAVTYHGLKFYGSPHTCRYGSWAFMRQADPDYSNVDKDIDILITHGPPYGILDMTARGERAGSRNLAQTSFDHLKLHVFGHIHESYGQIDHCVNAAILDKRYEIAHPPVVIDIQQ